MVLFGQTRALDRLEAVLLGGSDLHLANGHHRRIQESIDFIAWEYWHLRVGVLRESQVRIPRHCHGRSIPKKRPIGPLPSARRCNGGQCRRPIDG